MSTPALCRVLASGNCREREKERESAREEASRLATGEEALYSERGGKCHVKNI